MDALGAESARAAADQLQSLDRGRYNPFNLFVADARDAYAAVYEETPRLVELGPGVHVVGNADPDDRDVPKVRRALERAEAVAAGPSDRIAEGLAALCRTHETGEPRGSTCVHLGGYGTRSSTLLRLGSRRDLLRHSEGPPCTSPYRDFTPLLSQLGAPAARAIGETATRKAS